MKKRIIPYRYIIAHGESVHIGYFEPPRHLVLKNTMRIVLIRHAPNILHVILSIPLQRILGSVGIVQVDKPVVRIDHLRISV